LVTVKLTLMLLRRSRQGLWSLRMCSAVFQTQDQARVSRKKRMGPTTIASPQASIGPATS